MFEFGIFTVNNVQKIKIVQAFKVIFGEKEKVPDRICGDFNLPQNG